MNRKLIRMALRREKGKSIIPCGRETSLLKCIIHEPVLKLISLSYNVMEDHSTRCVMIRL